MRRLLIANRGEIAVRVARSCREMGIESVAVYSDADRDSRHVATCDAAIRIGPPPAKESYLNKDLILAAAKATRADAIHPGYGFLSEDETFAQMCEDAKVTFVGPKPSAIRAMGNKVAAKEFASSIGVPLVEGGTFGEGQFIGGDAKRLPYPILLKAASGGGGRGMRIVESVGELASQLTQARSEAREAFGDETVYWERYIRNARHIEVQVLGDGFGNYIHLGERDCTLQRRHQKLLEETPSPLLKEDARSKLSDTAVQIARALEYRSAGTVEFVYDVDRGSFHFIEMNTRIQVEHPVTECVTGVDLVREQLAVAAGRPISEFALGASRTGCSIECRINAEDVERGFAPSPGKISRLVLPGGTGVRVDTHCEAGTLVSPYYDSMIAKLIVWDIDRERARHRMLRALREFTIEGIKTTIPFHMEVVQSQDFISSKVNTRWVEEKIKEVLE